MRISLRHVFVETNWVVDCIAPAQNEVPAAVDLLRKAAEGELQLHLPSVCLAEARYPLQTKFQPKATVDKMRRFVGWALANKGVEKEDAVIVRRVIDEMEDAILKDIRAVPDRLRALQIAKGLEIFPQTDSVLQKCVELYFEVPHLKPHDAAVLASVLVRSEELRATGENEFYFCEADSDLQPWDAKGNSKPELTGLFDSANVWVYRDFLLQSPGMPPDWHRRQP